MLFLQNKHLISHYRVWELYLVFRYPLQQNLWQITCLEMAVHLLESQPLFPLHVYLNSNSNDLANW